MKIFRHNALAIVLSVGCTSALMANATPAGKSNKTNFIRSVFIMPANPGEGRDPFFPDSVRPYENAAAATPKTADITSLVLRGFSGTVDHRLVIINNHTFAVGDEGDVITSTGRIHLRCVEIGADNVIVEIGGQYHKLSYLNTP
ncbi:MAG TPA: hypothetical protein VMA13_12550 [Candidatus Saccharimonadales bacterium]|nr:hypothetical protein [Candidatus Saccharimonadales bacterium]